MAQKKTGHHKKGSHKRKRIGAAGSGKGLIELLVGAAGGIIVGDIAANAVPAPQYVWGTGLLVGGGGLAYVGGNNAFLRGFGAGLFASGVLNLGQDSGALKGISGGIAGMIGGGSAATALPRRVAGFRDVPAVGAFPKPNAVGNTAAIMGRMYKGVY